MLDSILIDTLRPDDVEEAAALETSCGLNSIGATRYQAKLDDPHEILLVARTAALAGKTIIAGLFSARLVLDELQIDNIAVDARYRRSGIATALLDMAFKTAFASGARRAFLEVRSSNGAAIALYQNAGFTLIGQRKNYYRNPPEDALVLAADVTA